jgi:hypothetical protein
MGRSNLSQLLYLSRRRSGLGIVDLFVDEPVSRERLAASRWHYWIALGPVLCLVGAVSAMLSLSGLLFGMFCWVFGTFAFIVAIHVDVHLVRAAELEWTPGVGRYTYPSWFALLALSLAPLIMTLVGGIYLLQRRRHLDWSP